MAGDWIKMRAGLASAPKVVRILSALKADKCPLSVQRLAVVGALHAVWSIADAHSTDGRLDGYTLETIDDAIGWPGFAKAMQSVEWLSVSAQGVVLPRFDDHNGASAKRRAQDADRKRSVRTTSGQMSASQADERPQNVRPRGEERRVLNPLPPSRKLSTRCAYCGKPSTGSANRIERCEEHSLQAIEHVNPASWKANGGKHHQETATASPALEHTAPSPVGQPAPPHQPNSTTTAPATTVPNATEEPDIPF